jgi:purine-binding chemotaxis protein CheW
LLVFSVEAQRYALRISCVLRVLPMLHIEPLPSAPDVVAGMINVAGQVVPVMSLRRRLGLSERQARLSDVLVLAKAGEITAALPADTVVGVLDPAHVPMPAADIVPGVAHIAGVVKLEDGLVLIHDLDLFLSLPERDRLLGALAAQADRSAAE